MARINALPPDEADLVCFTPLAQMLLWMELFVHATRLTHLNPRWRTHNTVGSNTDWWCVTIATGDPTQIDMRIKVSAARRPGNVHPLSRIVDLMEIYPSWDEYTTRPWFARLSYCLQSFQITNLHVEFPEDTDEDGWFVFTATWGIDDFLHDRGIGLDQEEDDFFILNEMEALDDDHDSP